jgi:Pro-kumamolisin, activation domain
MPRKILHHLSLITLPAALTLGSFGPLAAQTVTPDVTSPAPTRITSPIDENVRVILTGEVHPLARPEYDQSLVDPQLSMERIQLVLKRSPQQETALETFMAGQLDPRSPNFHHWLSPDEFGELYGPSDADISAVTSWLESHGLRIYLVSRGRVTIEFSGTAAQVNQAFHVQMHRYRINGVDHIANDRDPSIPQALAPVITGIASLHDFFPIHQSVFGGFVKRDRKTGKITPLDDGSDHMSPELTYTDSKARYTTTSHLTTLRPSTMFCPSGTPVSTARARRSLSPVSATLTNQTSTPSGVPLDYLQARCNSSSTGQIPASF